MMNKNKLIRILAATILSVVAVVADVKLSMQPQVRYAIFVALYLIIGYDVIWEAISGIFHLQLLDEHFLMVIASVGALAIGELHEGIAVMAFYQIGELFQDYAVNRSRNSIAELMAITPEIAHRVSLNETQTVDPEELTVGDIIEIRVGERVPVDCVIVEGDSAIDTSALTGESKLSACHVGDSVMSGSINSGAVLRACVSHIYSDSAVSRVLELVENAGDRKAKSERFITRFAVVYTPIIVALAALMTIVPWILTGNFMSGFHSSLTFLVISCPCALVISVPLGFFGGMGGCARRGALVKGGTALEALAAVNIFAFDKTGTLTQGEFAVQEVYPSEEYDRVLSLAAVCESKSNHPIAKSIMRAYSGDVEEGYMVSEISGKGLKAVGKHEIVVGSATLMKELGIETERFDRIGTHVHVACDGKYCGSIIIGDALKEDSKRAVAALPGRKVMLTGDNELVAQSVGRELGIDERYSSLLPCDKVDKVEDLKKQGKVCFVGDGINDAPVIMASDVGVAMGALGSDAAIEAADIVLTSDKLTNLVTARNIARKTMRIVKQNIIFALAVKFAVLILGVFGLDNMWFAVFADVGVAFLAILNSMRSMGREI